MRAVAIAMVLLLTACAKEPPVYIPADLPDPPRECIAPAIPEPKLQEGQDATDLDAAKDRVRLKNALRAETNLRRSCAAQLKVLLSKGGK
jgi:hypothetical protein